MHIVINQSNNVFGVDAENKIFAQSTETITFDVTFSDPQATLQGLYCALLSDGGKTLALTTISGNKAVLDTNTIECVEYVAQWAIGTTRHAFIVVGESTKPLAIIDVEVAQNPLEGLMPPTESAPTYPTSAELKAILADMTEQANRAEDACKRAENAEASQVAKRAEEKAGEAVKIAKRVDESLDGKQDKFRIGEGLTLEDNVLSATAQEIDVEALEKNATVWDGVRLSCKNYEGKEQVNDVFDWWTSSLGELLGFSFDSLVNVKRITLFKRNGSGDDVPNGDVYLNLRIWRYTSAGGWIVQYESSNKVRMNDFAEGQPMAFDMVDLAGNGSGIPANTTIVLAFCDYNRSDKFVRASAKSVQFDTTKRYCTKGLDFSKYGDKALATWADYNGTPAVIVDFEAEPYFYTLNKKYDLPATKEANVNIRAYNTDGVSYGVAIGDTYLSNYSVKIGHLQTSNGTDAAYAVQIGARACVMSSFTVSIGYSPIAKYGSVAIGAVCSAGQQSVVIGAESNGETFSVGVGRFLTVGEGCTCVGFNTFAQRGGSVAIGRDADADIESVAIGRNGYAFNGGVSLGDNAQALADGSVAIGCKCQNNTSNSVKIQARNADEGATFSVKTIAGKTLEDSFIEFIHTDTLAGEVAGRRISASNFFAMLDQFGATDEISESAQGYGYYS